MRTNSTRFMFALVMVALLCAAVLRGAIHEVMPRDANAQDASLDTCSSYHAAPASGVGNVITASSGVAYRIHYLEVTASSAGYMSLWDGSNDGTNACLWDGYVAANVTRIVDANYWNVKGRVTTAGNALVLNGPIGATQSVNVRYLAK